MTCRELTDFIIDYLDGTLTGTMRQVFEDHLGECPDCVIYLDTYEQSIRLARHACADNHEEMPADVREKLVAAVHAARRQELT